MPFFRACGQADCSSWMTSRAPEARAAAARALCVGEALFVRVPCVSVCMATQAWFVLCSAITQRLCRLVLLLLLLPWHSTARLLLEQKSSSTHTVEVIERPPNVALGVVVLASTHASTLSVSGAFKAKLTHTTNFTKTSYRSLERQILSLFFSFFFSFILCSLRTHTNSVLCVCVCYYLARSTRAMKRKKEKSLLFLLSRAFCCSTRLTRE